MRALYSVLTRRLLLEDAALPVVLVQQLAAFAFAVAATAVVELARGTGCQLGGPSWTTWVSAAGSGVLYYGLAFWFYLAALRHLPASVAGAFLPLIPIFGVAAGFLIGERLEVRQWLGAALVLGATTIVATRQAHTSRPADVKSTAPRSPAEPVPSERGAGGDSEPAASGPTGRSRRARNGPRHLPRPGR